MTAGKKRCETGMLCGGLAYRGIGMCAAVPTPKCEALPYICLSATVVQ